jgi:hypothetical protein
MRAKIHALSGIRTRDPVYERSRPAPQTARSLDSQFWILFVIIRMHLSKCWWWDASQFLLWQSSCSWRVAHSDRNCKILDILKSRVFWYQVTVSHHTKWHNITKNVGGPPRTYLRAEDWKSMLWRILALWYGSVCRFLNSASVYELILLLFI